MNIIILIIGNVKHKNGLKWKAKPGETLPAERITFCIFLVEVLQP